ncbi:hypothetical protein QFC19_007320 [Naganishia cerealis]|uniref:Uncharacterized protein n=1 Tax=Naganishia cerealis TaxID=610337 RepID=A0ACC2VA92_9TREE|nr:hypothetical protein QFC19_007320 [Naganishia cerealis]
MLSAHPAIPLSQIQIDPNNRRLSLHTATGHVFNTVADGLPSPGNLTPITQGTPSSGSPAIEQQHLYGDSGDENSSPGTPGDGYDMHQQSYHHSSSKQYMNQEGGGPRQEELSRRMRMVDLSRLEAERQARGEGSDDDDDDGQGVKETVTTLGVSGDSTTDSPMTPVPGENARASGVRSQSDHGRARAPLKSSDFALSAETHGIQQPALAMTKHHLPAGLQITPATPPTSSTQPGSPSRKSSLFDRRHTSNKTAPNTPGSSPPMSAQATRHPKQHSGPLHDLKRFLNHHIGHHGDRPSASRTASTSFGGSQTPAPHPAVLAVAHDGLATPMSGMSGGHHLPSGVQTPGSQLRGQYFPSMSMANSTTTTGNSRPTTPGGAPAHDTPGSGWGSAAPSRHSTNQGGTTGGSVAGNQQQHAYQVKEHDRSAQKTREAHGHHTNHLVGFLKHHNRDHDKSSSTLSSFFHRATADEKAQARRAREEEKEKEREAKAVRDRERLAAKEAREVARAEGKSVANSPAPTPTVSRSFPPTAVPSIISSVVASGTQTPASPTGGVVVGPGHFPEPGSFEATQAHLSKKYGKWGRVLGSGAGGTVRLIKSSGKAGATVYAVKEFRPRRNNEDFKDYQRKVMAEFCVGVTLKHVNVIETVDIINDHGHFFEVSRCARARFLAFGSDVRAY